MSTLAAHMVLASAEMEPRLFDLDLQLIADSVLMIIAVFTLFLVASHFLFNPVRDMMQNRQNRIKSELENAAADMENARALKEQYEAKLKDIEKEAEAILGEARKKALANENKIVSEAKEEATHMILLISEQLSQVHSLLSLFLLAKKPRFREVRYLRVLSQQRLKQGCLTTKPLLLTSEASACLRPSLSSSPE